MATLTLTQLVLGALGARDAPTTLRELQDAVSPQWSAYVPLKTVRERVAALEARGQARCVPSTHPKYPSWYKLKETP